MLDLIIKTKEGLLMVKEKLPVEVMFWNGNESLLFGTQSKLLFESKDSAYSFLNGFSCSKPCTEVSITVYNGNSVEEEFVFPVIDSKKVYINNYEEEE